MTCARTPKPSAKYPMSSSPGGTTPATRRLSTPLSRKPASSHATCFAGPPTFRRAMMRRTFMSKRPSACGLGRAVGAGGFGGGGRALVEFVRAGLGGEVRGVEERLEGSGVSPPAVELVPGHVAAAYVLVVHVRYLKLAAPGGLERLDDAEHVGVVHVYAYDGVVGLRVCGLLVDADDFLPL